jgi:VanZ family protein
VLQFLLLTIAIVVYGSLYPFHFEYGARAANPLLTVLRGWPTVWDRFVYRDILLNVLLYIPLGLTAAMVFLRRHSRAASALGAIAAAFAVSLSVEMLQAFTPQRDPSLLDVLTNVLGGILGAVIALRAEGRIRDLVRAPDRGLRVAGIVLLAAWAVQEFYPLFPALGRAHLYAALYGLLHTRHVSLVETWLGVAEWFAVGLALESAFVRMRTAWLAALMLFSLCAQLAIIERALTASEVTAAAIALLLWHFTPASARSKLCAWLLGSAILLRELQPFYFLSVPQPFSWIPFAATLESGRDQATVVIARKAFDYGAMVFALRRVGWSYIRAGAAVAAALAVTEAIQSYLPGRSPEITDPLLVLLMMVVLRKADNRA